MFDAYRTPPGASTPHTSLAYNICSIYIELVFGPCPDALVRNHLAFLATHRGQVIENSGGFGLKGEAAFLSFFSPLGPAAEIHRKCGAVWLYPWSDEAWPDKLGAEGFSAAERIIYMQLGRRAQRRPSVAFPVERVESGAAAAEFASVQERGFLGDESEQRAWWADCFKRVARRNYARGDQDFLLARAGGAAAAVLLTVRTGGTAGIYAVATIPEERGKGLSSALLDHAIERSAAGGARRIVLQVMAGSYAHEFYRRRGFEDHYFCQVWRR